MIRSQTVRTRSVNWRMPASVIVLLGALTAPAWHGAMVQAAPARAEAALTQLAQTHPGAQVRVIVQLRGQARGVAAQVARLGGHVTAKLSIINALVATVPARAVAALSRETGVRYVSLDAATATASTYTCCTASTLREVYTQAISATNVWNGSPALQGQGIGVAVVDSGINNSLADFADSSGNSRVLTQVKFNSGSNNMNDAYGHGTHVAGIIAGNGTTSSGAYIGVAPRANLINIKVSDDNGGATVSDVVNGLQWVYNNRITYNIRVVNLSLNSTAADSYQVDPLDAAVETLWNAGIVVVVSAGNAGTTNAGVVFAPANDPFVITVGAVNDQGTATTADDTLASFSSYGTIPVSTTAGLTTNMSKPDLVAPGVNITSTLSSGNTVLATNHPANVVNSFYFRMSGTSMAAPMVSGAAALLLQSNPNLTPDQVKARLVGTARPLNQPGTGAGEVNVYDAVRSTSTACANGNLAGAASLQNGNPAANWSSASWGSTSWGSASWGSASWGSASWGSASWGSASWGSVSWGSDYWGG